MPNRLVRESSPYLLQHADNPVDWYPWGDEALQKARAEDKPIFLSIGYSSCHWCHVMAHESFEDERVAGILNQAFVPVKVDREERPDLDGIYMGAVQAMTGSGGWPMSVFLTPDGLPFYGGTYFPARPRHGMPAFGDVLRAVADAWKARRQELLSEGWRLVDAIQRLGQVPSPTPSRALGNDTLDLAWRVLRRHFDRAHGGWNSAPKFPQPMTLEFLLQYHHSTGNADALDMVTRTLDTMARGGIYDQLGGGFHRYSVDERWAIPHFEKMLYDNAQLARVYLHAWQVTGCKVHRTVAEETVDYVIREMTSPAGGFCSSQEADSEGEEGRFFLWTPDEIQGVLGAEADSFIATYGVTPEGIFEGRSVLRLVADTGLPSVLNEARRKLLEARERRVHPGRDDKVITSWNGLMLATLADAARAQGRDDYRKAAERCAIFVLHQLRRDDGRLFHTWKDGTARVNGFLEDYGCFIEGLVELYQTTFDHSWYAAARQLAETMLQHFRAPDGTFFDTSDDHEALIVRPRGLQDNAIPSGSAMATIALLKLARLSREPRFGELPREALAQMQPLMAQYPLAFSQWLQALSYALSQPLEIAIVGNPGAEDARVLLAVARDGYWPSRVLASGVPGSEGAAVPILEGRGLVGGHAAAYVCQGSTCQVPLTEPSALRALLSRRQAFAQAPEHPHQDQSGTHSLQLPCG